MRKFFRRSGWILCFLLVGVLPLHAAPVVPPSDRILILISLDGFRWDYLEKFHPTNLNRLAAEGVHTKKMISSFPSLTFPNHYTLVTGLYPEHNGIVANEFYDPVLKTNFNAFGKNSNVFESRWWAGEPIWVTAIKQGRTADCLFWPGSETDILGVRPTESRHFNKDMTQDQCVELGLEWLAQPAGKRPDFLTLYFYQTDTTAHHNGPDSPEVATAVAQADDAIGHLLDGIHRLNLDALVNLVIVSDHGMSEVSTNRLIVLSDLVEAEKVQVDFAGAVAGLRPLAGTAEALYKTIKAKQDHFQVYRRENMPRRFHFRDNDRIPPVVLVADDGWYISKRPIQPGRSFEKATHGYDPELDSMGALFIANGPAFKRGVTLAPFDNIHVYDLLCATLGLKPAPNDGDNRLAKKVLAK